MKDQIQNILRKGKNENASESDRKKMLALFHQPEKEFLLKEELLEELENTFENEKGSNEMQKVFYRIWSNIKKNEPKQKSGLTWFYTTLKIAAALVIGLFLGIYVTSVNSKTKPEYYSAHAPKGSVSQTVLPDGTIIFLNADSHLKFSMEGKKGMREVFLEGEAWFDVAKNKKKPFIVHTDTYDVEVTGTRFNIKTYDDENEVTTTLEEGSISVQSTENFKIGENIILKPGEQLVLNRDSKTATVKEVNTKWFTSWKDNKLIFINMELKDLVVLLERKYGVDIEVKREEIMKLHFDGTIKDESIIEILEILKKTLPIDYIIEGQKIEITNKKKLN
ncbi:MAG TPA: FecR domain-containing protein [Draconibacterium sp.]|nr:FecR domain-containing protein [Draconibacterium sp.]